MYCHSDVDISPPVLYGVSQTVLIRSASIPPMGYSPKNNHSVFAHKWLSYTDDKDEIYVQQPCNGGEKREGNYLLDGYREETHTAFEVHGCFWHGCPRCYARDTMNPVRGSKTMQELHHCTMAKIEYLKRKGYNLVEVWECDVNGGIEAEQRDEALF